MAKPLNMKQAISAVGVFVVALGWYFYGGDAQIAAEQAAGTGWNDARVELVTKYEQFFGTEFKSLEFKGNETTQMAECLADKSIEFLNGTDCRYKFNAHNMTREEHLAKQEACLKTVGFDGEETKQGLACFKKHCPNDWSLIQSGVAQGLKKRFLKREGVTENQAQKAAECSAKSMLKVYGEVKCPFVIADADSWQSLLNTADKCHAQEGVLDKVRAAMAECSSK